MISLRLSQGRRAASAAILLGVALAGCSKKAWPGFDWSPPPSAGTTQSKGKMKVTLVRLAILPRTDQNLENEIPTRDDPGRVRKTAHYVALEFAVTVDGVPIAEVKKDDITAINTIEVFGDGRTLARHRPLSLQKGFHPSSQDKSKRDRFYAVEPFTDFKVTEVKAYGVLFDITHKTLGNFKARFVNLTVPPEAMKK